MQGRRLHHGACMPRVLLMFGLAALSAVVAGAQTPPNQCAECHLSRATAPGRGHVLDWESSAHKRSGIGCERCHGGDPAALQVLRAHFGVEPEERREPSESPECVRNMRHVS